MKDALMFFGMIAAFLVVVRLTGLGLAPIIKKRETAGKKSENPYVIAAAFWIVVGSIALDILVEYVL